MMEFELHFAHPHAVVAIDAKGSHTYEALETASNRIVAYLLENKLHGHIALLCEPGFDFMAGLFGIWKAGSVAIPLAIEHPPAQWAYYISDSQSLAVIVSERHKSLLESLQLGFQSISFAECESHPSHQPTKKLNKNSPALILYTSGTTSKPKGVILSHKNILANVAAMQEAWQWKAADKILNVLPLHHTHGLLNVVLTAAYSGACIEFLEKFDAEKVFRCFENKEISLFMAVPTVYFGLIDYWEKQDTESQKRLSLACQNLRLMVSGSAALPPAIMEKWERISGHRLLERYGMTEIGMALSNPLHGERRPGFVGLPMPGVQLRLMDENGLLEAENRAGEIQIKADQVFEGYWQRDEATQESFTADGWFKTGDVAEKVEGYYRILGRSSVDIIKTGGYKVSALEIEAVLLKVPEIKECAVLAMDDAKWGEVIVAVLVASDALDLTVLKQHVHQELPHYKWPRKWFLAKSLARNTMGKLDKKQIKNTLLEGEFIALNFKA